MTDTNQDLLTAGYAAADKIFDRLETLGVSTNQNLFTGLMCDYQSLMVEGAPNVIVVKIYDDYDSGLYDGQKVWDFLNTIESASFEDIWGMIAPFEL